MERVRKQTFHAGGEGGGISLKLYKNKNGNLSKSKKISPLDIFCLTKSLEREGKLIFGIEKKFKLLENGWEAYSRMNEENDENIFVVTIQY